MTRIGILLGTTRANRVGEQVAYWVLDEATAHDDTTFELIDLRDWPLPHFDEPMSPVLGDYQHEHTKAWAEQIASYDGFVIVTAEYNHGIPGVLKNAIDYLFAEWNHKAVGFVSYGSAGGARAVEHLRLVAGEVHMAPVRQQVTLSMRTDFEAYSVFKPAEQHARALAILLGQVIDWSRALRPLRTQPLQVG